jgi:uroporphyrinogen decarboxylase
MMVSSFPRILSAIRNEPVDRVPVVPQMFYAASKIIGLTFEGAMNDAEKMARALLAGRRTFGYDGVYADWESFTLITELFGCETYFKSGMIPMVYSSVIRDRDDLDRIRSVDPERDGRLPAHLKTIEIIKKELGGDAPIFTRAVAPFTLASLLRGTNDFLRDIIRDPELVNDIMEKVLPFVESLIASKIERGADIIVIVDPIASGSLISRQMFKDFSFPFIKDLVKKIDEKGAIPSLHICGDSSSLIDLMIETDARILELDHQVDIAKIKREKDICVQGNMNPPDLITKRPEQIFEEARKLIEDVGNRGFILSTGCDVPYNASLENIKSMVDASHSVKFQV